MRRHINGSLTAVGGVCALVVGLMAIDERVRLEVSAFFSGRPVPGEIATLGGRLKDAGVVMAEALRDQSIEHAPLTIFALAALILVMFLTMTRT